MKDTTQNEKMTKEEASCIFLENIRFIRGIALKYAPSKFLQEDIVHDSYVYFVQNAALWEYHPEQILGLLKRVTRNMASQHWRTWVKNQPDNMLKIAHYLEQEAERDITAEQNLHEQKISSMKQCIQKLNTDQQNLLELFYYKKVSYRELAQRFSKTADALYMQMSRIRVLLQKCVRKAMGWEDDRE